MTQKTTRKPAERLLLPIIKREPEKTKVVLNLSQDVHADIGEYQRAYRDMNGTDITLDFIIEQVLIQHMRRDKAFQTWKTTQAKSTSST